MNMIHMTSVMTADSDSNNITFHAAQNSEMLRITNDGFYVRGIRLEQDEKEAEKVYNAFHAWLTWATLNRHK